MADTVTVDDALLDEIEQKAKAATESTPGRWKDEGWGQITCDGYPVVTDRRDLFPKDGLNFDHIARCDPPTVLALVAEVRRLRAEVSNLQEQLSLANETAELQGEIIRQMAGMEG